MDKAIERVVVVTGGTGALGRVIVNKFAEEGLRVYVPVHSMEEFNKVFDSSQDEKSQYFKMKKIYSKVCDATDENSVIEFINDVSLREKGNIHCLINTVGGIAAAADVVDLTTEILDNMISLNFKSAFYFTREALKVMKKNNYGRIISIGAIAGTQTTAGRFAYSFTKAGVINLMNTVSEEMKEFDIRCNTIIPGILDTPANREWGTNEDIKKWVKPGDVAEIIYDFISDKFSSIRETNLKVYGNY